MNKFPKNVGYHDSINDPENVKEMLKHTKVFQFFVSDPKTFNAPHRFWTRDVCTLIKSFGARPVIHCPYLGNMTRGTGPTFEHAVKYTINLYLMLMEYWQGKIPYVLHTGKPEKGDSDEKVRESLKSALQQISDKLTKFKMQNAYVCVETDASNRSPVTRLEGIAEILSSIGDPKLGITFDTEHSFASGRDPVTPVPEEVWKWVGVLHLNAIPEEVKLGSGLDRHSHTKLRECSKGGHYIKPIFRRAIEKDLPIILERRVTDVILDDMEFLSNLDLSVTN